MGYKVAIVGATGNVGREMLNILEGYDLAKLGDELRFALITSAAQTAPLADAPADAVVTEVEGLKLKILKSAHAKCGRCWHFRADVGSHAAHPELCGRCVSNIEGIGEVRKHA